MQATSQQTATRARLGLRILGAIALITGAIPLLAYPMVLGACVMGIAGYRSGRESTLLLALSWIFIFATIIYPVIFFVAWKATVRLRKQGERLTSVLAALGPLAYLILLAALFQLGLMLQD